MGWRGTLRSINAAARRADREREREANRARRVREQANRLLGQLSDEAQRDMRKVEAYEEKIYRAPINTLRMRYSASGEWDIEPLVDRTGKIQFTIGPTFHSDPVVFRPELIFIEGRTIAPLACALTQYATFVAFDVRLSPDAPGSKSRQLINKSTPENSCVAILADGQAFYPFDGSLDAPKFNGISATSVVAFEPFVSPVEGFEVAFAPPATKKNPDPDGVQIRVDGKTILRETQNLPGSPSLVDQFEQLVVAELDRATRPVGGAPRSGSGSLLAGCLGVLFALILLPVLACFGIGLIGAMFQTSSPPQNSRASVEPSDAAATASEDIGLKSDFESTDNSSLEPDVGGDVMPSEVDVVEPGNETATSASEELELLSRPVVRKFRQRAFMDDSGQFTVEATLVSYIDGVVTIRRADNHEEVRLPFERLSEFDQKYVTAVTKARD